MNFEILLTILDGLRENKRVLVYEYTHDTGYGKLLKEVFLDTSLEELNDFFLKNKNFRILVE